MVVFNRFVDGDSRNEGGPAGLPGMYQVIFLLQRPGFSEIGEKTFSFVTNSGGDSHLAITKPAYSPPGNPDADQIRIFAITPDGRFTFTGFPNSRGFLGKLATAPFNAQDRFDAERKAYGALGPAMSNWSVHLDIPIHVAVIETTEIRTGNASIRVVQPFLEAPFAVEAVTPPHDSEFAHYASLYREALNSNSPGFRYLCLFKIIEGVRFRRARLGKEAREKGQMFGRPAETIPDDVESMRTWLDAIFPIHHQWDQLTVDQIFQSEARGKNAGRIIQNELI
ncbi:MAG: methylamine utilization protein MauJ, partial [Terriglobales bacterium]